MVKTTEKASQREFVCVNKENIRDLYCFFLRKNIMLYLWHRKLEYFMSYIIFYNTSHVF